MHVYSPRIWKKKKYIDSIHFLGSFLFFYSLLFLLFAIFVFQFQFVLFSFILNSNNFLISMSVLFSPNLLVSIIAFCPISLGGNRSWYLCVAGLLSYPLVYYDICLYYNAISYSNLSEGQIPGLSWMNVTSYWLHSRIAAANITKPVLMFTNNGAYVWGDSVRKTCKNRLAFTIL